MTPTVRLTRRRLLPLALALLVALLAYISPVSNANADPHLSLVVSQAIVERHSLQLDAYREAHHDLFTRYHWQTKELNGHLYYNYPLAPSIVALPAVAAARLAGMDMLQTAHNHLLQNALSAAICALIFLLLFLLCRVYLDFWPALLISIVSTLGSTLYSTVATAYWNLGVAVLFILLALLLIARYDAGKASSVRPTLLGALLFCAYFTRPSAAIFIVVVFLYLFIKNRRALLRTAAVAFAGFVAFVLHSRLQYGLWLPVYYTAGQWFNPQGLLRPLYGVSFSPSRGLFTFSPFFLLTIGGGLLLGRRMQHALLYWLCLLWLALHLFSVALTPQWHGGFSFGPRLLTDAVPGLALMTAILWRSLAPRLAAPQRRLALVLYLLLGLLAIFVHTVQGTFNTRTALWNAYPNIDSHPQLLFDWRYPQFLTTLHNFHERRLNFYEEQVARGALQLAPYEWGQTLTPTVHDDRFMWAGWWPDDQGDWWVETPVSSLILPISGVDAQRQYTLEIAATAASPRRALISINGHLLGETTFEPILRRETFIFDGSRLAVHNSVRIVITLPELYETPPVEAFAHSFSYNPHEDGLKNAAIRLAPLPEN